MDKIVLILWIIFVTFFSFSTLYYTTQSKFKKTTTLIASCLFCLTLIALNIIVFYNDGASKFALYNVVTVLIPLLIWILIIEKKGYLSSITSAVNIYMAIYALQILKATFSRYLNDSLWVEITAFVLYLIIWVYIKKFYINFHKELETVAPRLIIYLLGFSIITYAEIISYGYVVQDATHYSIRLEIFGIAVLSVYFLSYAIFYQILKSYKYNLMEISDRMLEQKEISYLDDRLKVREKKDKQLRILRHDFRHVLITMRQYLKENNMYEANKLIDQYIEDVDQSAVKSYCSDYIIDSIIDYYVTLCEKKGIEFNINVNNFEQVLNIPSYDFAIFLSNCLENAVHGTSKLITNRRIDFTFINNHGRLVLQIKNTFNGEIKLNRDKKPTNRKKHHGLGTNSIDWFAEKHNLIIDYNITKELFIINVLFKQ